MSEDLKDRPAVLRRTPRPAPDEKVDPVDYSPAAVAPAPMKPEEPTPTGGGVAAVTPVAAPASVTQAPPRQAAKPAKPSKAAKAATNRKTARREVTFPLSTRLSQEVIDVLYAAAEDEGISVREAIEQAIKSRWGQN